MTESAALRDLCDVRHGGTPSKAVADYWQGDIPWISPKDMKTAEIDEATDHISADAVENSATSVVPPGTVLVVVRSGILAHSVPIAKVLRPVAFNQDIKALIPKSSLIEPEYLFWFVRAQEAQILAQGVKKGATVHSVRSGFIETLPVPLLGREEQRRIVDILGRADAIVRLRGEAQDKAQKLIPALFGHMFGDPATNPRGWNVVVLGELIAAGPQNGIYKPGSFYGEGTPILRIDAFYDGRITDPVSLKRVRLERDERDKFRLCERDIVINRVNSIEYLGKSTIVPPLPEETVFESNMMRFTVDESRILSEYLIEFLQTKYTKAHVLANAKRAINQASINQQDVRALPVSVPPREMQERFARRAEEIRSIQSQQVLAAEKARATFEALLAAAFHERYERAQ